MKRMSIVIALVLTWSAAGLADYILDRQAGVKLVKARKYKEAMAAFLKMAQGKVTDFQKSDALEQAVYCALRLKQHEQATKLARQIPMAQVSKYCRMSILASQRKRAELIETFKDEDFSKWPDFVAGPAFRLRGYAYQALKKGKEAEADLKKALTYPMDRRTHAKTVNALGAVYSGLLKDDAKAIETYRKALAGSNVYAQCRAVMSIAGILQRQKKYDEAVKELSKVPVKNVGNSHWRRNLLCALGDALAKAGKKAEAIAKYKEAMQVKGTRAKQKVSVEKKIKALEASAK